MLEEHALRYLVTRQIWALRETIPGNDYEEVTSSVTVTRDKTDYIVTWSRIGEDFVKRIPRSAFVFYRKGDREGAEGVVGDHEAENVRQARLLALEMVGREEQLHLFQPWRVPVRPAEKVAFAWSAVFCAALAAAGPAEIRMFAALLLLALWAEYVPRTGRVMTACAMVIMAVVGPPITGGSLAAMYAIAQFLDPNRHLRMLRTAIAAAATALAIGMLAANPPEIGINGAALAGVLGLTVAAVTVFRWTVGSHFRVLPVLVGMTAPTLALEGYTVGAILVAANAIVCLVARLWGWHALPHPNAATYQGVSRVSRQ